MAGVTPDGFVQKTVSEIIASIQAGYRTVYGVGVNVAASSRIGQRIALFAGALSEVWELGEAIANSLDPDAATGIGLDNLLKLAGLSRKPATSSTVVLTLTGVPTTLVATGKRAQVLGTLSKFALDADATIAALSPWLTATSYSLGQRATNGGNAYQVTTPGLSAAGPSGTGAAIPDGTVVWRWLGAGTGAVDAPATSIVTGPVQAFAYSAIVIDTPVAGWNGVINMVDAFVGANVESDPAARARRAASLAQAGVTPLDSIRTEILAVAGVTSCTIFENFTDATVDGIPMKSFEAVVEGGVDQDVIDAIGRTRPGGIQAYGTTSGVWLDNATNPHTIAFSRPTLVDIWVKVTLAYDVQKYPTDGDELVKDTLVTVEDLKPVGKDVVASSITAGVFKGDPTNEIAPVPGIFDVSQVLIGTSNPPVASTTIAITPRQRANFDTSRVTVVSAPGSF